LKRGIFIFLLSLSFCLSFPLTGNGQGKETGMLKLRTGYGIPIKSFGKFTGDLDYSSFVTGGAHYGLEGFYFYSENVGFGGLLSYNRNKIDAQRFTGAYINSNFIYDTAFVNINPFRTVIGLVGFCFDLPLNEYAAFTFKMMAGALTVTKPAGIVRVQTEDGDELFFRETKDTRAKFTIFTAAGMRFSPLPDWSVTMEVEYIGAQFDFSYKMNEAPVNRTNHVQLLMLNFGIAYFIE